MSTSRMSHTAEASNDSVTEWVPGSKLSCHLGGVKVWVSQALMPGGIPETRTSSKTVLLGV